MKYSKLSCFSQKYNCICSRYMRIKEKNYCKTEFNGSGFLETSAYNFKKEIGKTIIKHKVNMTRSLIEDIKTKQWYDYVQQMDEGGLRKEIKK